MEWSLMVFQSVPTEVAGQGKEVEERGRTCEGVLVILIFKSHGVAKKLD
jgi:hypothetical protein